MKCNKVLNYWQLYQSRTGDNMIHNLEISDGLYNATKDYTYETEVDMNDFIIEAIIEKINNENSIFHSDVDKDGWTNKKTSTENFLGV